MPNFQPTPGRRCLAQMMRLLVLATACALPLAQDPVGPLVEPYPLLHGDNPTGGLIVPTSPDPLVRVRWDAAVNITALQRYETVVPCAWVADPPSAFSGLDTLKTASPKVVVSAPGSLRLDWCGEHPAWFEFTSPDLSAQPAGSTVLMSISEYNEPWYQKTQQPKAYAGGKYRLETNSELYEGVRFSWIFFDAKPTGSEGEAIEVATPWHITGVKLVSQVKPVNYTGSFNSSDDVLTGSWYTGAYGSKVNMCADCQLPHAVSARPPPLPSCAACAASPPSRPGLTESVTCHAQDAIRLQLHPDGPRRPHVDPG